jgi:hypothetical protein
LPLIYCCSYSSFYSTILDEALECQKKLYKSNIIKKLPPAHNRKLLSEDNTPPLEGTIAGVTLGTTAVATGVATTVVPVAVAST